jgi:hypothetical protein
LKVYGSTVAKAIKSFIWEPSVCWYGTPLSSPPSTDIDATEIGSIKYVGFSKAQNSELLLFGLVSCDQTCFCKVKKNATKYIGDDGVVK